jgi:hypothetical protein
MRDQVSPGTPACRFPGLGVCDVRRLELSAVQLPWLLDELQKVRGLLKKALDRAGGV